VDAGFQAGGHPGDVVLLGRLEDDQVRAIVDDGGLVGRVPLQPCRQHLAPFPGDCLGVADHQADHDVGAFPRDVEDDFRVDDGGVPMARVDVEGLFGREGQARVGPGLDARCRHEAFAVDGLGSGGRRQRGAAQLAILDDPHAPQVQRHRADLAHAFEVGRGAGGARLPFHRLQGLHQLHARVDAAAQRFVGECFKVGDFVLAGLPVRQVEGREDGQHRGQQQGQDGDGDDTLGGVAGVLGLWGGYKALEK